MDRWQDAVSRVRLSVTDLLRKAPGSGAAVADLLDRIEELDRIHREELAAGGSIKSQRRRGRQNTYRVVKGKDGAVLEEIAEGRQPFRCPESVYNTLATVITDLKEPARFEDILRQVRKRTGELNLPDYQARMCLRLWISNAPQLVEKVGTRYGPKSGLNVRQEVRRVWRELVDARP